MSFIRILTTGQFELYTDIRQLREGKTGKDFQSALKNAIPQASRKFDASKRCWVFRYIEHISTIKSLCEIYFKDEWKTKDLRQENPAAYLRNLMFLHEDTPDEVVKHYFVLLCNSDCQELGSHSFDTISETYDRTYIGSKN